MVIKSSILKYSYRENPFIILIFLFPVMLYAGCSKTGDTFTLAKTFAADSITVSNVSYKNFIQPLLAKNCATCHGEGGSAAAWWLNTNSYYNALKYATPISTTITNNTMPPPPKFPFTDRDKELIIAWINRGSPN